ncbi:hypothetical protein DFH28DRAFT_832731, partial [Melampsora americana]
QIAGTTCAMVAFAKNRRQNGLQLHNALTFLAVGVSERLNCYLQKIGLCSSRRSAIRALTRLQDVNKANLRRVMNKKHTIPPMICFDNIDLLRRVSKPRVDGNQWIFRGTYGYVHAIPPHLGHNLDSNPESDSSNLKKFLVHLTAAHKKPVKIWTFLPTEQEQLTWKASLKTQLTKCLYEYIIGDGPGPSTKLPTSPPPIEEIPRYNPHIYMLKMLDCSENSAEGVSHVLEGIAKQTAVAPE